MLQVPACFRMDEVTLETGARGRRTLGGGELALRPRVEDPSFTPASCEKQMWGSYSGQKRSTHDLVFREPATGIRGRI
jgi:hypothetical protein